LAIDRFRQLLKYWGEYEKKDKYSSCWRQLHRFIW
jgi:hypothetical protein